MSKMKKIAIVSFAAVLISLGLMGSVANAKTSAKTLSGKVKSISGSSLTLKVGSKTYTINDSSSTKVIGKNGKSLSFSSIMKNDSIKATGKLTSKTMDANKITDKSRNK